MRNGQCDGPKINTDDGLVCQLTGLIVEDNSHSAIPYIASSQDTKIYNSDRAGFPSAMNLDKTLTTWFSEQQSVVERQETFYRLLESRKQRMMTIVPIVLTTSNRGSCKCRGKAKTLQVVNHHAKRYGNNVHNMVLLITKLKQKTCRHCNTMSIDHLTLQKMIEIYVYVFSEWHLRLTLLTEQHKNIMKEENFAWRLFTRLKG